MLPSTAPEGSMKPFKNLDPLHLERKTKYTTTSGERWGVIRIVAKYE